MTRPTLPALRGRFTAPASVLALALALLALLATASAHAERLRVVTTFLPAYCVAVNVAGPHADVEALHDPGVGPHNAQLNRTRATRLARASLVVANGLGLEPWLPRALQAAGRDAPPTVVELGAGLDRELIRTGVKETADAHAHAHDHAHDHAHEGEADAHEADPGHAPAADVNPHIWLDPQLMAHATTNLLRVLQRLDPANAEGYRTNATAYVARLHALDQELRAGLAAVREQPFVTFHDAFPYFVRRYDLRLVGVLQAVPDVDPSPRALAELLRRIRATRAKVLFTEPQFSPRLAQRIAQDVGLRVASLHTLETGPHRPTAYEDALRENLRTLQKALQ